MPDFSVRELIPYEASQVLGTTGFNQRRLLSGLDETKICTHDKDTVFPNLRNVLQNISTRLQPLIQQQRVHSRGTMSSAAFSYINKGDAADCEFCEVKVSGSTLDMDPSTVHKQQSPTCAVVRTILVAEEKMQDSAGNANKTKSTANEEGQPSKRLKTDTPTVASSSNMFLEVNTIKEIRTRTFSNWPHRSSLSAEQMIHAGFFCCNVSDRVICIYCNIICQQWTPQTDNPCEVHKTLSPKCPYVIATLLTASPSDISIINEVSTGVESISSQAIVHTTACHPQYNEVPKRLASFSNWPTENLPSFDEIVKAGFFYTGTRTIVTCFYCNGSLQNWGANDNPTIEHARWFPNCAYARQLCGNDLYRRIQESKRAQQERARVNNASDRRLVIPDENTLSRFVAARLDLPISQSLLDRGFKLSVIKRCWEDQLRLKRDDFVNESDLLMACTVLEKQIEFINGKKENIIVPSVAMKRIRDAIAEVQTNEQTASESVSTNSVITPDVEMTDLSKSNVSKTNATSHQVKSVPVRNIASDDEKASSLTNPCLVCAKGEKRLACLPCSHLVACDSCGQSIRSCPTCHRNIDAFVRIYL